MLQIVQSIRDLREFLAAKKRKREPLRFTAKGAAESTYVPRHLHGYANFRRALRQGEFGAACEWVERIEDQLKRRHGVCLPLPRKVMQNADCSVTTFWDGISIRAFPDGPVTLVDGKNPTRGVSNEVLDLLAFQARIQR